MTLRISTILTGSVLAVVVALTPAAAVEFTTAQKACFDGIAKSGLTLVKRRLQVVTKCENAKRRGGECSARTPDVLAGLDGDLADKLARACNTLQPADFANMGFPGPCPDADASDGYTLHDLQECMRTVHDGAVDEILRDVYEPTVQSEDGANIYCQTTIAQGVSRLSIARLHALQKCRQQIIDAKLALWPEECDTNDAKTHDAIEKAEADLDVRMTRGCTDAQIGMLGVCTPDQSTVVGAVSCLTDSVGAQVTAVDETELPHDCGDGLINGPDEQCDGANAAACPGRCGPPNDPYVGCLCTDLRQQRVIELPTADFDLGWAGNGHDQGVGAGGYVVDLFDCDGPAGPDTTCTVGPSCSLPPHEPCSPGASEFVSADTLCPGAGNSCRKTAAGATGPHCAIDLQKRCRNGSHCPLPGDRCVVTSHGPPLPLVQGGVSVCMLNQFSEDVVGTVDLASGAGAVRLRHQTLTYLGDDLVTPCPVCGNFCALDGRPCVHSSQCGSGPCVTAAVCSDGPNRGRGCRRRPPLGGVSRDYGTTSVDCPPGGTPLGRLDVEIPARTTGLATLAPSFPCAASAFAGNACIGGDRAGRQCVDGSECPGGTCDPQCFCEDQLRPNACGSACVGGPNAAAPCGSDDECPGGFCHAGDCRVDPSDTDSVQEGHCTVLQTTACANHPFRTCASDADCRPPSCSFCESDETCLDPSGSQVQCFVNDGIVRQGSLGTPARTTAATFCVPGTGNAALDTVAGVAGPAALTQPEISIVTGF